MLSFVASIVHLGVAFSGLRRWPPDHTSSFFIQGQSECKQGSLFVFTLGINLHFSSYIVRRLRIV